MCEVFSWSVSSNFVDRQAENSTSGLGSFWERSSAGSQFSTFLFQNVFGTVPKSIRTCGLTKNSYFLDRAPKMRDSVLLNSWDGFSLTLPSISSETSVMYPLVIPGTNVFYDWPFLGCSCEDWYLLYFLFVWYVSITCKIVKKWIKQYYIHGNEIVYCLIQFHLIPRGSEDVLFVWQHLPTGFADMFFETDKNTKIYYEREFAILSEQQKIRKHFEAKLFVVHKWTCSWRWKTPEFWVKQWRLASITSFLQLTILLNPSARSAG